jgi:hypothetical protein
METDPRYIDTDLKSVKNTESRNHPMVEKDTVSDDANDSENNNDEYRDQSDLSNIKWIQTSNNPIAKNKPSYSYEDRDIADPIRETKISSQPRNKTNTHKSNGNTSLSCTAPIHRVPRLGHGVVNSSWSG